MSEPRRALKVFLCHASTDKPKVRELYRYLKKRGINPWFDEEDLVGGQDWQVEIPKALATSDAIIICLTKNSVDKEGYIQKEIKFALDKALEMPEGRIFLIPVKFEECEVPFTLSRYQWVDLTVESGYAKMMKALKFRASQLERSTVEVSKKDVEEENLAREKAEKEAAEKARLETEELERQKATKEKAQHEVAKKVIYDKTERIIPKIESVILNEKRENKTMKVLPTVIIIIIAILFGVTGLSYFAISSFLPHLFNSSPTPTQGIALTSSLPNPTVTPALILSTLPVDTSCNQIIGYGWAGTSQDPYQCYALKKYPSCPNIQIAINYCQCNDFSDNGKVDVSNLESCKGLDFPKPPSPLILTEP